MDFIKRMLQSGDSCQSPSVFLQSQQFSSVEPLPPNYQQFALGHSTSKATLVRNFFQLVQHFQRCTTAPAAIKTLTIILASTSSNKYDQELLEELQGLQTPQLEGEDQVQWIRELAISMKSYLVRLPSVGDVLRRALPRLAEKGKDFKRWLSDLYLLINLLGLLFPFLTNAFNTYGRYYLKPNSYFHEFYRVISEQLSTIYSYLRTIVTQFMRNFKACPIEQLQCFIQTLPQIELLCDKLEELLLNKYFRGRGPSPKIYVKEEEVAEIAYYLKQRQELLKEEEEGTAEDEFGEYQF